MRQRYRADAMAFWLHLVPKLRRRDNSFPLVFHAPEVNATQDGQVRDDVTMTQVTMETVLSTKPRIFPWSVDDRNVWTSFGFSV